MRRWLAVGISALVAVWMASCSGALVTASPDGSADAAPAVGGERGACYPNSTCNAGLTCIDQVCVSFDAGKKPADAGIVSFDAGKPFDAGDIGPSDAGLDASGFSTLYDRLGGHAGITSLDKHVFEDIDGILADPQLLSYFYIETPGFADPSAGPTALTIEACFTDLLANASGGPENYPTMENGFTCRDMKTAHANLHVTTFAFQKFVSIWAAKYASLGVASDDLQTLGGAMLGTQADIVDNQRTTAQKNAGIDAGYVYGAPCPDIDGGATTAAGCTTP
jgi:hypothetical protein